MALELPPNIQLYRRCPRTHFDGGQILPSSLRLPDLSVIRADLAKTPDDARWSCAAHLKAGQVEYEEDSCVIAFPASAVPSNESADNQGKTYGIAVVHDPCEDLYPHSEVRMFDGETRIVNQNAVPGTVKKKLRQKISDSVVTVWLPGSP